MTIAAPARAELEPWQEAAKKLAQERGVEIVWSPHADSQTLFLQCPVFECFYSGTRGVGKTDALLIDYAQHVGKGWGPAWRGVIFRHEYKPLAEIVHKSKRWFKQVFPRARWLSSQSDYKWVFPDGEELMFRAFKKLDDYWDYHGHELPFIAWEELTASWANLDGYHAMKSCCRSTVPGIPLKYRATGNPYGKGHNAVKAYFIDPAPAGVPFIPPRPELPESLAHIDLGEPLKAVRLSGHYSENTHLMKAQPNYAQQIAAVAENEEMAKAWLAEDWDIVAGGMFDDVWRRGVHVLQGWPVRETPPSWRMDRAYDWGSSKPFSVGWWAESDGTTAPNGRTYPRGTLFRVAEWYGMRPGQPNVGLGMTDDAIARRIVEAEKEMGVWGRVSAGPADTGIFDVSPGRDSIATVMAREGVGFTPADKRPGSRKTGWNHMRRLLRASLQAPMEDAGLFVFDSCHDFIRTVPTLTRSDRDPDDVDTDAEDHIADETRYRITAPAFDASTIEWRV